MLTYQLMMYLSCKLPLICGPIRQEDRQSLYPVTKYPEIFPLEKIKSGCTDEVIVMGRHTEDRILQPRARDGLQLKVKGDSAHWSLTAWGLGPQLGAFHYRYKYWVHNQPLNMYNLLNN